ncbi:MAG: hypothetical protein ACO1OK_08100 [Devosia sp.]
MKKQIAALLIAAAMIAPAQADEISDTIQEALDAYQAENISGATQSLNYAIQLISQMNSDRFAQLLPAPLSGWTAEDVESESAGMAMFGGGMQVARNYTGGSGDIRVEMIGDSPILGQFIGIFANPAMMSAMGKPVRVGSQNGLEDQDGKLTFVVANRFLVTIDGGASRDDKLAYANAIDFNALSRFGS